MKNVSTEKVESPFKSPALTGGKQQVGVMVRPSLRKKLEELALTERRSLSQLGEMAIEEFIERRERA